MKLNLVNEHIRTIDNFWTKEKCESFISASEEIGYSEALVKTDLGYRKVDSVRNNKRIIHDNAELARSIWEEASEFAPTQLGNYRAIGLNERFRFYKYNKGQQFKKHKDMSYIRNPQECSFYTFMIYLNDDFTGGTTNFGDLIINPMQGSCLMFYHPLEHEGAEILEGTKYILRSDIMYRKYKRKSSQHNT